MRMPEQPRRKGSWRTLWRRWESVSAIISLWERLPSGARTAVKWSLTPVTIIVVGLVTGALHAATGFVQNFWALIILSLVAGVGAGAALTRPINSLTRALDCAASRKTVETQKPESDRRTQVRDLLPNLPDSDLRLLRTLIPHAKRFDTSRYASRFDNQPLYYFVKKVGPVEVHYTVWKLDPEVEDIVKAFLDDEKESQASEAKVCEDG